MPLVPAGLAWWSGRPGGRAWLERLPRLVAECARQWQLEIGPPVEPASVALVLPVRSPQGAAVLKLNFPERDSQYEGEALACWNGRGAVRLLAHDVDRQALLLERCRPGGRLWDVADEPEALAVIADCLRRLWRPVDGPFLRLAEEARRWQDQICQRYRHLGSPFDEAVLDEVKRALLDLPGTQGPPVLLHQDLHGGNVLRAEREPWLVIDPKPLVGEREFDAASFLRDRRPIADRSTVRYRLDGLSAELGLDRERTRLWGMVHALAWGMSFQKLEEDMVRVACWLHEL